MQKTYHNPLRNINEDEPIFSVPAYQIKKVYAPYSQSMDWGVRMLGIPNFWRHAKGEGIRVAVLDTGVDTQHRDLIDNVKESKDFTGSKAGVHDVSGHGTHCAGIIAAKDNSFGVVGVAPKADLYIAKVLNDNGLGTERCIVDGINWAIRKEVNIISMSFGAPYPSTEILGAIRKAINQNIIVICAAGNEGPRKNSIGYPAKFDEVIAVGAVDSNFRVTNFSSRGNAMDIVAPGNNILSTYPPNGTAVLDGTSMATPFVAGVAALILSKHKKYGGSSPVINQEQMLEHLQRTAIDLGPKGFDSAYGFGLINTKSIVV